MEQHERHLRQGELHEHLLHQLHHEDVGAGPRELQLQETLLPDADGALRRFVKLRRQPQVGLLPFGGRQVEHFERILHAPRALDRGAVAARERRAHGQRRHQALPVDRGLHLDFGRLPARRHAVDGVLSDPRGERQSHVGDHRPL